MSAPTATVPALEFGPGAVERLPGAVAAVGARRVLVVTDPGVRAAGVLATVLAPLDAAGISHAEYADVHTNPTTDDVLDAAAAAGDLLEQDDVAVLALGGGSALDVAKGVGLMAHGATLAQLLQPSEHPGLPLVAVPTTAGTGAETNGFAVLADPTTHAKCYLGAQSVRPRVTVLDPELTLGIPARVTASTGMDALTHGIESLASRGSTPESAACAVRAVELVHRFLERAVRDGSDLEARGRLLYAAHLAGRALTLSGLGLVHGIAHATTGHTGAAHGLALAAVLDLVMEATVKEVGTESSAADAYGTAARAMGVGDSAGAAIDATRALAEAVGARNPLSDHGVTEQMVPLIARDALADVVSRNAPWLPDAPRLGELLLTRL